ncbi:MAG: HD domain-containing protein [Lachnospiraceae bacterium]|nr:HD domain-containing protein [Lachnospiraceae bacterium]
MRVFSRIYNELFYAGLGRYNYQQVRKHIEEMNRVAIVYWSVSIGLFWILSLILSLFLEAYAKCRPAYAGGLICAAITWFCSVFLVKRFPWLLHPVKYLLTLSILMVGIGIAVFQPFDRTATMIAMVVIIPNCFIDPSIRVILTLGITIAAYCVLGRGVIDPPVYNWGLMNLFIFSMAGLLTSHVINRSRFRRYYYEASTKKLAEVQTHLNARLVMGMATMVESRDNSTGGHIRRTSMGVRFLVEAMKEEGAFGITEDFCENIIKAAPLHDVGKIAVDDVILRKPGLYTSEEYEKMKKHPAEGARILHDILNGTDEEFCRIAENVAHYHHERMDGSGYPEGLKGDEIPLEARIMAVADVYDALVSKRVYKEAYSFEKANEIILDGMGTQFDAKLQKYYEAARPKLERYYAMERENNRKKELVSF